MSPRTLTERELVAIWSELLGVTPIYAHDNFLDLGGHSLLAMRVAVRIQRRFGVELPVSLVFDLPVLSELAMAVDTALARADPTPTLPEPGPASARRDSDG